MSERKDPSIQQEKNKEEIEQSGAEKPDKTDKTDRPFTQSLKGQAAMRHTDLLQSIRRE